MRIFLIGIASANRSFSTKNFAKPSKWAYCNDKKGPTKERSKFNPTIKLTDEQKNVLSAIREGHSLFITGSAGTGKSHLVQEAIKSLKKLHKPSKVAVTASTGIAACALKGQTLHSFSGVGLPTDDCKKLLDTVLKNKRACRRWRKIEALVIDEISMINAALFDNLEYIAREIRGVNDVWGGIQLVVSGDFFQLPPIPDEKHRYKCRDVKFAFEADCWNESFNLQVELTEIFRQTDYSLIRLLQGIRTGKTDPKDLEFLEQSCSETEIHPSAVQLYPLRKDVDQVNESMLQSLQKNVVNYIAIDDGEDPWKQQLCQGIAPDELSICEGARVILVKNINPFKGLVNGAAGEVVGFYREEDISEYASLPVVKFDFGKEYVIWPETWNIMDGEKIVATRKQIPLILAWAMSIHKCQGMTLDKVYTDLSKAFGPGMVYVALSRVRRLDGLHLSGFDHSKIQADPKVSQFYQNLASKRNKKDLGGICNNREGSTGIITDVPENVSPGETKYHFSLEEFLSRRLKRK